MVLPSVAGPLLLALLVVESVLIALTVVLIVLSRMEADRRIDLVEKLVSTAEMLSRKEYFLTTVEAIQAADGTVEGMVTGSRPDPYDAAPIERVLEAIRRATGRGVTVRYVLPVGQERLHMGHRYEDAGADVRFHPGLLAGDARFMVVDGDVVVIGFPDSPGEGQPTRRGQRVYSEKVARLFLDDLEAKWDAPETMTLDRYLGRVVEEVVASHPGMSAARIADDLDVPLGRVEACLTRAPAPAGTA